MSPLKFHPRRQQCSIICMWREIGDTKKNTWLFSIPSSLLCPPPPLHLSQPPLQYLYLLLQVSSFISRRRATWSADTHQHTDTHQDSHSDGCGFCVHTAIAKDESKTHQSHAHFQQPKSPPQSGGNQSEGKGEQPVANDSHKNPLGNED